MNRNLLKIALAVLIGTGLLLQRAQRPKESNSVNASKTREENWAPPIRVQSTILHSTITPPDPPEDPDEARAWTRNNLRDALAWLVNAPAGEQRDTIAEITCAQIAEFDPAQAVSLAERYSGGCSNLLENMVQQWADLDEASAYAYAVAKPAGDERDRLLSRVAFARSKDNPAEAAQLVAQSIAPGELQKEAAMSVLHQWALRDPSAALAWAKLFPEETFRDRAVKEVTLMLPQQPN